MHPAAGRDGLKVLELSSDTLALASPPDRSRRPSTDPRDVGAAMEEYGLVQLARVKGPGLAGQVDAYLAACELRPEVIQHANDLQTVLALVAAGVGAALVPERVRSIAPAQVAITPIDHPAARWQVGVVWDPHRPPPARSERRKTDSARPSWVDALLVHLNDFGLVHADGQRNGVGVAGAGRRPGIRTGPRLMSPPGAPRPSPSPPT
ncbi:LysR substrate-binding domain-containing protein [Kitasatospora sp. NPDC054939]